MNAEPVWRRSTEAAATSSHILARVIAVLDWEMATIGDPLMDFGTSLGYWVEATDPEEWQRHGFGLTSLPGSFTRAELLEHLLAELDLVRIERRSVRLLPARPSDLGQSLAFRAYATRLAEGRARLGATPRVQAA